MKLKTTFAFAALVLSGFATTAASQLSAEIYPESFTSNSISFMSLIVNNQSVTSGPLRYELWATPSRYLGGTVVGYKVWQQAYAGGYGIGPFTSSGSGASATFAPPPDGTYYFSILVTEFRGGAVDDGYAEVGHLTYSDPISYPIPSTPQLGLWWNPAESGSGYFIDLQHGVVVVTIYSYNGDGTPQWYLMTGTLTANNTVSGPLTKFKGGQCIACAYKAPMADGNDGVMTIVFTSPEAATVTLAGSRSFKITPFLF